ncbi:MAG: hypothetical protein WKF90_04425 [Pyrinomonadaceae bacterium]
MKRKHSQKYRRPVAIDISRMKELYESGLSLEAVGKRFGISKQRVAQIFDKAGVKKRNFTKTNKYVRGQKSRRRIIPKETLIELYINKKLPVKEITKTLKTSSSVLYRSLAVYKIAKRVDQGIEYSPLTHELLRRLYIEEDLTSTEIARRLCYAPVTIRKRLSAYGIKNNKYKR